MQQTNVPSCILLMCLHNTFVDSTFVNFRHTRNLKLQHDPTRNSTKDKAYNQHDRFIDTNKHQAREE